ncbi:hypothetical protein Avbf_10815 [Armadillidium vulgare]|nr:hypothetical protein Avbf_10815 [Armadillidium vulgare]
MENRINCTTTKLHHQFIKIQFPQQIKMKPKSFQIPHEKHPNNDKTTTKPSLSSNTSTTQPTKIQGSPTPKKNLLQTKAEEHNVRDKKLNDQEGIQMEKEYLIDVTPKPASTQKKKTTTLGHKKRAQNISEKGKQRKAMKEHSQSSGGVKTPHRNKQRKPKTSITATTKNIKKTNKSRKYTKKYNAQKHSIKKSPRQRDRKTLDKKREKREKLKEKRENKKKVRN